MSMVPERARLHLAMTVLLLGAAGNHIILRAALNMGVSKLVFPLYRNIIALFVLAPFAYFSEKKDRPPLTTTFLVQFFLLGFVGIEQVHLNRKDGIAKVLGTLASVAGASEMPRGRIGPWVASISLFTAYVGPVGLCYKHPS
uniref:WAT1-related protein n=1 Tax=Fagus sylvatica TaxID=28930 RepID=A0A2N9GQP6_FAGSY